MSLLLNPEYKPKPALQNINITYKDVRLYDYYRLHYNTFLSVVKKSDKYLLVTQ